MQPGPNSLSNTAQVTPEQNLQNGNRPMPPLAQQIGNFEGPAVATQDDFLDQMLSSWNEFEPQNGHASSAWDLRQDEDDAVRIGSNGASPFRFDESALLVSKLRQHQISGMTRQQQLVMPRTDVGQNGAVGEGSLFASPNPGLESSIQGLYNGFAGSSLQSQPFLNSQIFGDPCGSSAGSAGGAPAQPRQRVRARRGQATDPHSIAERLRRERISERMKALQELIPNANKSDKASMLDEIIDYVKFLQLQVKVLSMSRLGGAAAVTPLVADMSPERGDAVAKARSSGARALADEDNAMALTEQQVAKLMAEDMGSAMQYLQGKGLCLMPISLATVISTATCQPRSPLVHYRNTNGMFVANGGDGPTSPSASVLTVQSAAFGNGVNDATSGSMP